MKRLLSSILVLTFLLTACSNSNNTDKSFYCNERCVQYGFSYGECLQGGSGVGMDNPCGWGKDITNESNPIPGCDLVSIGSWDSCCCYE